MIRTAKRKGEKTSAETFAAKGNGDDVFTHLACEKSLVVLNYSYTGQAHFLVKIVAANGEIVAITVDRTGKAAGKVLLTIPKDADNYLLQISADGAW
ncbi:hypothetical protein GIX45_10640 [Erwinia sp. CPCC 100877]|nr:hypothetical protein [Erwinia sp. CPCC 100877]